MFRALKNKLTSQVIGDSYFVGSTPTQLSRKANGRVLRSCREHICFQTFREVIKFVPQVKVADTSVKTALTRLRTGSNPEQRPRLCRTVPLVPGNKSFTEKFTPQVIDVGYFAC